MVSFGDPPSSACRDAALPASPCAVAAWGSCLPAWGGLRGLGDGAMPGAELDATLKLPLLPSRHLQRERQNAAVGLCSCSESPDGHAQSTTTSSSWLTQYEAPRRIWGCSISKQPCSAFLLLHSLQKRGALAQQKPPGTPDTAQGGTSEPGAGLCQHKIRSEAKLPRCEGRTRLGSHQFAARGRAVGHKTQPLPREIHAPVKFCSRRGLLRAKPNCSQAGAELPLSVLTYPRLTERPACN